MTEKTINEVVREFKEAFGSGEFKALNNETQQELLSKNWKEPALAKFEIDGADYLALGNGGKVTEGVIAKILKNNRY